MTTLHYYVWILATLLLGTRVSARKVLQQEQGGVGVTALDLTGKDLADFVSSAIVKSERALAKQKGLLAQFSGEGTAYSAPVKDATGFACSRREIPEKAKRNFVAINNNQWNNGTNCGKCVQVWCVDSFCTTRFQPRTLMIMDKCPECKHGDLDLSFPAYEDVTGRWPHRLKFEWKFVDCSTEFNYGDKIRMDLKKGPNTWWRAFYFSMQRYPLVNVTLNGRPLTRNQFGFWNDWTELGPSPYKIALTAESGETVEAVVDDVMKDTQYLNVQFKEKGLLSSQNTGDSSASSSTQGDTTTNNMKSQSMAGSPPGPVKLTIKQ